ncbi:S-layer homology domain-containing protein [Paenibacillus eucommiae]|uniref:SLH domain-containing protein n=1 Tax=Paenibacillus eucommiae TaxID=1355755 RepID=A0ABS4ISP2_9BACL|nr:S-layer homology domain-containing protein [Paenibacillus eucommiae]MBP1990592.1 hypothetical protein [Paenibacillus eucommiae]
MRQKRTRRIVALALSLLLMPVAAVPVAAVPVAAVPESSAAYEGDGNTALTQVVPYGWSSMSNAWSWVKVNGTKTNTTVVHFADNKWYTVGYNGGGVASVPGTMTLLSVGGIGAKDYFNPEVKDGSQYIHSQLRAELTNGVRFTGIDARERSVMVSRTLDEVTGEWPKDQLWALSVREANLLNSDLRKTGAYWWLRSPGNPGYNAATVNTIGGIRATDGNVVYSEFDIRPAFNLDLASVIFASAAEGGKAASIGQQLSTATAPIGAVKLTVVDSNTDNLNLTVPQSIIDGIEGRTYAPGSTVEISYSDAIIGTGKYVSSVIVDNNVGSNYGVVTHYGKLSQTASGIAVFTVPSDLADGSYTIKLFNEEHNGDKKTDYASAPVVIKMAVETPTPTPTPTHAPEDGVLFMENEYLKLSIDSAGNKGGAVSSVIYKPDGLDLTGSVGADKKGGLFRDRIPGIADLWNELEYEAEIIENTEDRVTALVQLIPSVQSQGVEVKKYYTLRKGRSSIETNWEIINNGNESIGTTPWVWNNVLPDRTANYYMPTENLGLHKITAESPPGIEPSRNWVGAIDIIKDVSISFIMDYNKISMDYQWEGPHFNTLEWAYESIVLEPGESWSTTYFTNIVPLHDEYTLAYAAPEVTGGIKKWRELEVGIENSLEMELSSVVALGDAEIEIEIIGSDDYRFTAPNTFNVNLSNEEPAKINWTWTPPSEGTYLLKASLYKDGIKQPLGESLQNPTPDIEVPLVVGKYAEDTILFPAWPRDSGGGKFAQRKISGAILSQETDLVIWSVPSLEKIFLDDIVDLENSENSSALTVDLAKREREAVQIVLSPKDGNDYLNASIYFSEFINENGSILPEGSLKYNPVGYVFTKSGSRYDSNIRTGYWPDPLLETEYFDVEGGQNTPIWITVYAEPEVESGIYEGNVIIKSGTEEMITIPMSINVWPFSLPATPKLKTALDFKGVPAEQVDLYIDNFLEHRITPRSALGYVTAQSIREDPDFIHFDAKMESLLEKGLNTLMVHRDNYLAPDIAQKLFAHLREKGWLDMTYVYLTDEPTEETFPTWIQMAEEWKSIVPDVKIMITTYPTQALVNTVDIWSVPGMRDDPQEAENVLQRGEELWWYHTDPPHPNANFLIDMPAVDVRATFWQSWQGFLTKGYTGFLYSWSTWVGSNPWEETGPFISRNGTESQIYPSENGPVNSIRWEVIRDGIEDYDYSFMLWELLQRVEQEMPENENKEEVIKAKNLLEFPMSITDYIEQANIVQEAGKWRKEVADSIIFVTALLERETLDGSTISATYDGNDIASGDVVLAGKEMVITVVGKGSDFYTYEWSGTGTSGQTTNSITINPLDREVAAIVTVTGLELEAANPEPPPPETLLEPTPIPKSTPAPTPTPEKPKESEKPNKSDDENPFTDVNNSHWFYDSVKYVYNHGLMNGVSIDKFNPLEKASRGMIVTILYTLEERPKAAVNTFKDVEVGKWYTDAIAWAAENKIVNGYGNERFGPNNNITREQMAVIFFNYAKHKGYDLFETASLERFTDTGLVSGWASEAMKWMVGSGTLIGKGNNILDPEGTATRAEIALIMQKFAEKYNK